MIPNEKERLILLEKAFKNADHMARVLYLLQGSLSKSGKALIDKHWEIDGAIRFGPKIGRI